MNERKSRLFDGITIYFKDMHEESWTMRGGGY